ncbi:MAG: hypothetical protein L6Q66_12905 [Bacteroidia bacterium]|nr:hypothetical protein [Bacteroidia bacterium]
MKKRDKNNEFNREEDLTLEELKQSPEFKNLSDEQILKFIEFFKTFSHLVYQAHRKVNCCEEENEMIIDLHKNTELKIAA